MNFQLGISKFLSRKCNKQTYQNTEKIKQPLKNITMPGIN